MKKKLVLEILTAALIVCAMGLFGCGQQETDADSGAATETAGQEAAEADGAATGYIASVDPSNPYASGTHHAVVSVEGYDPFTIELDADDAPVTVASFCANAGKGVFDGSTFHRVQEGFCLQGGRSATGDELTPIVGEFKENGVDNALADDYRKGTVAMARSTENSATSEFFVTLGDDAAASLNGKYAAFGTIDDEGMKVVDQIVADYAQYGDEANMGFIADTANMPVITSIEIVD